MSRIVLNPRLALQAVALKVAANLLVQLLTHWDKPAGAAGGTDGLIPTASTRPIDWQQIAEFALFGLIGSQVGNNWQHVLEHLFPGGASPRQHEPTLDAFAPSSPVSKREDGRRSADLSSRPGAARGAKAEWRPWRWSWSRAAAGQVRWRNLAAKLVLDQTIGQLLMGTLFLVITNFARVQRPAMIIDVVWARVGSFIWAGWHLWPLVAICNFLFVPVRSRVLVASCVGFGWSIFLSFFAMKK